MLTIIMLTALYHVLRRKDGLDSLPPQMRVILCKVPAFKKRMCSTGQL